MGMLGAAMLSTACLGGDGCLLIKLIHLSLPLVFNFMLRSSLQSGPLQRAAALLKKIMSAMA